MQFLSSKGILFILSSPSGAGKTTMASLLTQEDKNIVRSISFTTRTPREHELNGRDYFFLTEAEFQNLCNNDDVLEYATVFGNYYGTPKKYVFDLLAQGKDVLCCIDWQGARQITSHTDAVTIFLLPPSLQELKNRLNKRSSDSNKVIVKRLEEAKNELLHTNKYDYVVVNEVVEKTIEELRAIIKSERAKVKHKKSLNKLIQFLVAEKV
ncbi:MAG: guanylate kinase [Rickettsiaceae bacterium H1]|nr:guanylate kinase [Rickettsiaceae bacterium H1]